MLILFAVYHSVMLSVIQHMDAVEALDVLFELGIPVIPHLKVPEFIPYPVPQDAQENAVFPAVLDLL